MVQQHILAVQCAERVLLYGTVFSMIDIKHIKIKHIKPGILAEAKHTTVGLAQKRDAYRWDVACDDTAMTAVLKKMAKEQRRSEKSSEPPF